MIRIKLKDIANVYNGYSNKINLGDKKIMIITSKGVKSHNFESGNFNLRQETIDRLSINSNTILISNISSYSIFEYGRDFPPNAIVGKGLYKIEFYKKGLVEYVMSLIKSNAIVLPYEGSVIKTLKIKDLENLEIPIANDVAVQEIINLERYSLRLERQSKNIKMYVKSIWKGLYE